MPDQFKPIHRQKSDIVRIAQGAAPVRKSVALSKMRLILVNLYANIDDNKDGFVTVAEFKKAMKEHAVIRAFFGQPWSYVVKGDNVEVETLESVFNKLDLDHDGKVTWEEFSAALDPAPKTKLTRQQSQSAMKAVFKAADKDANGTLTKDEIVAILHNSDILFSLLSEPANDYGVTYKHVLENLSDDLDESDAHNVVSNLGGFNWEEFERKCQTLRPPSILQRAAGVLYDNRYMIAVVSVIIVGAVALAPATQSHRKK